MFINVQDNTLIFKFEEITFTKIKLIGNNEKIYSIENRQVYITANDLDMITDNKQAFVSILYLENNEWLPISIENTPIILTTNTEIKTNDVTYTCYIASNKQLKIFNEGFISNKVILDKIAVNDCKKKNKQLIVTLSLSTKYFKPSKFNLFLRDRKHKNEIIISTKNITETHTTKIEHSFEVIHHCQVSVTIDFKDLAVLLETTYNPDEPFFNWIDFYYNFTIAEYSTSGYPFRLPNAMKKYPSDLLFEMSQTDTCLLKTFVTQNNFVSLNYYVYKTTELNYFIKKSNEPVSTPDIKESKPIIIIGEYYNTARDNGLAIFKYLIKYYKKDFQIIYGITENSSDLHHLKDYMNHVKFIGSEEYSDYFLHSDVIIHSHFSYYLCPFSTNDALNLFKEKKCYFIQHGIILQKDVSSLYSFDNYHFFNYFITSSKRESKLIEEKYHFPNENILNYGLPRFDALFSWKQQFKKITRFGKNKHYFAFFTWRNDLEKLSNESFIKTDYYIHIQQLINDPFWADNPKLTLTLRIHRNLEKYVHLFSTNHENVSISTENDTYSIQDYIIKSDVMITDYSSVALDFAITSKPVVYFLGLAENNAIDDSYQRYLPGQVVKSYTEFLSLLHILSNTKKRTTKYGDKLDDIYTYRDNKACYRLAEHIKNNTKRS